MKSSPVSRWYLWLIIALTVKGVMFLLFIGESGNFNNSFIGAAGGDTESYLKPVENIISTGNYDPDYRMPGYGMVYYLLRLVFDPPVACNALIIIQNILASLSVYVLALISFQLFKSVRMFYLVYFSFLISSYTSLFDIFLLTESFAVSASVFGCYFFIRGLSKEKMSDLFLSGLSFTWLVFLRPVYAPYLPLCLLIIYFLKSSYAIGLRKKFKFMILFLLPFLIIDGIWITRNYSKYNSIIPLTRSIYYPDVTANYYADLMSFLQSWGGSYIFWDPNAEIRWFGIRGPSQDQQILADRDVKIPDYIYTSKFNNDSLKLVRQVIMETRSETVSPERMKYLSNLLSEKFRTYTESIKSEHPFLFHVKSRLIYLKKYIIHSGTYNLYIQSWSDLSIVKKAIKLFYSFQYLFILLTGIIGSLILLWTKSNVLKLFIPFITLYSIVIFPVVFRLPEIRYFVPAFPFILISSMFVTNIIFDKIISYRLMTVK